VKGSIDQLGERSQDAKSAKTNGMGGWDQNTKKGKRESLKRGTKNMMGKKLYGMLCTRKGFKTDTLTKRRRFAKN